MVNMNATDACDAIPVLAGDDEKTLPGRCTIVGVYNPARRPWSRLTPEIVEFAEGFCASAVDPAAAGELRRQIMAAAETESRMVAEWLEMACSHAISLGYLPGECLIEHHDRPRRIRHVLCVRRMECFDVTVVRCWDGQRSVSNVMPRVLGWPPPRRP